MPFFVLKALGFPKLWCESYFAPLLLYTSPTLTNTNDVTSMKTHSSFEDEEKIPDFVRVLKDPENPQGFFREL